jgi:LuxR family maltose regulon positive regulatory protein
MAPLLERFARGSLRVAGELPSELQCSALHLLAGLALGAGRIDEAQQWLARADDAYRWLGMTRGMSHSNAILHVMCDALRGERAACHAAAERLTQDLQQHSPASHRRASEYLALAAHSQASWVLQDTAAVRALDAALTRAANRAEWRVAVRCRQLSQAFVALLDERLDDACALLEPLSQGPNRGTYFQADLARVLRADALLRLGRRDEAARTLQRALDAARASGEIGGALLAGALVLQRLAAADWRGRIDAAGRATLAAWAASREAAAAPAPPPATLAPLSEREREVLALLARGDSNKLIARAFDLSPHTVKRHVANILNKLGVDTRGQAAARWRAATG